MMNRHVALQTLGLDVRKKYTANEIKRAFRSKALLVHPDKSKRMDSSSEFVKLSAAYQFLINDQSEHTNRDVISNYALFVKLTRSFIKFMNQVLQENTPDQSECDEKKTGSSQERCAEASRANSDTSSDEDFFDSEEARAEDHDEDDDQEDEDEDAVALKLCIDVTIDELYKEAGKKLRIKILDEHRRIQSRDIVVPFVDYRSSMTFVECGDWHPQKRKFNDLVMSLNIVNHNDYCINDCMDPFDLVRSFPISVSEYFSDDMCIEFCHFGEKLRIQHSPYKQGTDVILTNKGLKKTPTTRGDLYVLLNVDLTICKLSEISKSKTDLTRMFPARLRPT